MRRFSMNRWMTLVLSLALVCASLGTSARIASATILIGDGGGDEGMGNSGGTGSGGTPIPGPGSVGDPDSPQNGYRLIIKGTAQRTSASRTMMTGGDGRRVEMADWMWRLQVAFKTTLRLRFMR